MLSLQSVEQNALRLVAELCSTYTPAGREAAALPRLDAELRRLGAKITAFPLSEGRANILAMWGEPRVLFSTHLDVVPPDLPIRVTARGIEGRGACDAKGQIAAQLAAIELLLDSGLRDFAWLGVAGEESDSAGAKASIALAPSFSACCAIIVGEPTACALATGQKGFVRVRLTCKGKTAHGATPELGENALFALMDWIGAIRAADASPGPVSAQLGRETWNLGLVSGGRAANVVPDLAEAELSLRTVPDGRLRAALEDAKPQRGAIEVLVDDAWAFFDTPPGFSAAPVPFGSDLPTMRGIAPKASAVLAGPGRASLAHTGVEELSRDELAAGIKLFRELGLYYSRSCP